jgi:diguanylate cyclase (GGDEF)-like protein/PAS domain S-box-containing protein
LCFAFDVTQIQAARRLPRWLWFVIPAITIGMLFSPWQALVWAEITTFPVLTWLALRPAYGAWFWVHTLYSYAVSLASWILLLRYVWQSQQKFSRRSRLILAGVIFNLLASILYLAGLFPTEKDFTPVTLSISNVLIAFGVLRNYLFNLRPMAALTVTENLSDGVILLNTHGLIADLNAATENLLGANRKALLGQNGCAVVCKQPEGICIRQNTPSQHVVQHAFANGERYFEVTCQPLRDITGQSLGRVLALHDITERLQYAWQIEEHNAQLMRLQTLSQKLIEQHNPEDLLDTLVEGAHELTGKKRTVCWLPATNSLYDRARSFPADHPLPGPPADSIQHAPYVWQQDDGQGWYLQPVANRQNFYGWIGVRLHNQNDDIPSNLRGLFSNLAVTAASALQNMDYRKLLEAQALYDPLTGVFNRRGLQTNLPAGEHSLVILSVDMDNLKTINDTWGHEAGDLALVHLTEVIRQQIRGNDLVARVGGDEFLCILPGIPAQKAGEIAQRLLYAIQNTSVALPDGSNIPISVSLGVAVKQPEESLKNALHKADLALYQAKRAGKNRVCEWNPEKNAISSEEIS